MSDDTTTATIRLSQEELLFILGKALDVQIVSGMGDPVRGHISQESVDLLFDAAERALIARRIIVLDEDNTPRIDRGVHAAVSVCAHPDQAAALLFQRNDSPVEQHYYYRVPELTVTHTLPLTGLHVFEVAMVSDMGFSTISELLRDFSENIFTTPTYVLNQSDLAEVQGLVSQDGGAAVERLVAADIAAEHAQALVGALAKPKLRLFLQFIYRVTPEVEQKVLTLIADQVGCWLVEADRLDAERVVVQGLPTKQILEVIRDAHAPLTEPLQAE